MLTLNPTQKLLLVDDNVTLCDNIRKYYNGKIQIICVHNSREALKLMEEDGGFDMILVDLRLDKGKDNSGLSLIRKLQKKTNAIIGLFTGNSYDPSIEQEIYQIQEKIPNFGGFFRYEKGNVEKLNEVITECLSTPKRELSIDDFSLVPSFLKEELIKLGKELTRRNTDKTYEEGRLYYQVRMKIEERREELKDIIKEQKTKEETVEKAELESLSKLWTAWIGQYAEVSEKTVHRCVEFYLYFSNPEYEVYRGKLNLSAFQKLTQKIGTGRDQPYLLSPEDQHFLLQYLPESTTPGEITKIIDKFIRIRKVCATIEVVDTFAFANQPLELVQFCLERLSSEPEEQKKQIKELLSIETEKIEKDIIQERLLLLTGKDDSELTMPEKFYLKSVVSFEKLMESVLKTYKISAIIVDNSLITLRMINMAMEHNIQLLTLKKVEISELEYQLDNLLNVGYIEGEKIICYLNYSYNFAQEIFDRWERSHDVDLRKFIDQMKETKTLYIQLSD